MQQYSCNTCGVVCADREALRRHYDGDLHADNVKRRVNGLVPLTAQVHGARSRVATSMQSVSYKCTVCDKRFATAQTLNSHIQSQKHKEMKAKRKLERQQQEQESEKAAATSSEAEPLTQEPAGEEAEQDQPTPQAEAFEDEPWELAAARVAEKDDLTVTDCVFCNIRAPSLEDLLCHMAKAHQFAIPMADKVIDISALVTSLADKVNSGACLVCGEDARVFDTRLGVQDHMAAKGHQMIKLSSGDYDEYYQRLPDFQSPAGPEEQPIDYVLPNGKIVVSKQEIKFREAAPMERESVVEQRLLIEQRANQQLQAMPRYQQVLTQLQTREMKKEKRAEKQHIREQQKHSMRLGIHLNCLHGKGYQGDYVGKTL